MVEEAFKVVANEEFLSARVLERQTPDELLLAEGRQGLIFRCIKVGIRVNYLIVFIYSAFGPLAIFVGVLTVERGVVVTPVMELAIVSDIFSFWLSLIDDDLAATGLIFRTTLR